MAQTCILDDNTKPYVLARVDHHAFRLVPTVAGCSVAGIDGGGGVSDLAEALIVNHGTHDVTLVHAHSATEDLLWFGVDPETGLYGATLEEDASIDPLHRIQMRSGTDLVMTPGAVYWAPFSEPDPALAPDAPVGFTVDNQGQ